MKDPAPVAVASRSFSCHPILRDELLSRYESVTFNDKGTIVGKENLIDFLRGHSKAIVSLDVMDEAIFAALPGLKVVSKYGVGLDTLDLDAMERHGVKLAWTGGVNKRSVAELVIAMAISLLHRLPEACDLMMKGEWMQLKGRQLSGRTVGIVGCGQIGKEVAKLMGAFGCRVLVYDILDLSGFCGSHNASQVRLEYLLRKSDIITLHVQLNNSTRNMMNADNLAMMKRGSVLINTARGGLVDEGALKRVLSEGKIAGAAFDVFETEPPNDTELLHLPNFIATPHISGSTEETILAMGRAAIAGLEDAKDINDLKSQLRSL